MTKKELRIAVAKDVIKSLRVLRVETDNDFLVADQALSRIEEATSNEIAKKLKKECTVCALGACLLSVVVLDNKFNFAEAENKNKITSVTVESILERLRKLFSEHQLQMIENAFEQGGGYFANRLYKRDDAAVTFGKAISDDTKRLRAIMKNIIANNGTFKPGYLNRADYRTSLDRWHFNCGC